MSCFDTPLTQLACIIDALLYVGVKYPNCMFDSSNRVSIVMYEPWGVLYSINLLDFPIAYANTLFICLVIPNIDFDSDPGLVFSIHIRMTPQSIHNIAFHSIWHWSYCVLMLHMSLVVLPCHFMLCFRLSFCRIFSTLFPNFCKESTGA